MPWPHEGQTTEVSWVSAALMRVPQCSRGCAGAPDPSGRRTCTPRCRARSGRNAAHTRKRKSENGRTLEKTACRPLFLPLIGERVHLQELLIARALHGDQVRQRDGRADLGEVHPPVRIHRLAHAYRPRHGFPVTFADAGFASFVAPIGCGRRCRPCSAFVTGCAGPAVGSLDELTGLAGLAAFALFTALQSLQTLRLSRSSLLPSLTAPEIPRARGRDHFRRCTAPRGHRKNGTRGAHAPLARAARPEPECESSPAVGDQPPPGAPPAPRPRLVDSAPGRDGLLDLDLGAGVSELLLDVLSLLLRDALLDLGGSTRPGPWPP